MIGREPSGLIVGQRDRASVLSSSRLDEGARELVAVEPVRRVRLTFSRQRATTPKDR